MAFPLPAELHEEVSSFVQRMEDTLGRKKRRALFRYLANTQPPAWRINSTDVDGNSHHNSQILLETTIENFVRPGLIHFLVANWKILKSNGLYTRWSPPDVDTQTVQARRLRHYLILQQLRNEEELYQWERSIAEFRNLENYQTFLEEMAKQRMNHHQVRKKGEGDSTAALKAFLQHIYVGQALTDKEEEKKKLERDLRTGDAGIFSSMDTSIVMVKRPRVWAWACFLPVGRLSRA